MSQNELKIPHPIPALAAQSERGCRYGSSENQRYCRVDKTHAHRHSKRMFEQRGSLMEDFLPSHGKWVRLHHVLVAETLQLLTANPNHFLSHAALQTDLYKYLRQWEGKHAHFILGETLLSILFSLHQSDLWVAKTFTDPNFKTHSCENVFGVSFTCSCGIYSDDRGHLLGKLNMKLHFMVFFLFRRLWICRRQTKMQFEKELVMYKTHWVGSLSQMPAWI